MHVAFTGRNFVYFINQPSAVPCSVCEPRRQWALAPPQRGREVESSPPTRRPTVNKRGMVYVADEQLGTQQNAERERYSTT